MKVHLTSSGRDDVVTYTATTDAEGKFTLADIKPGAYQLSVDHLGFFFVDQKRRVIRGQGLTLRGGDEQKDITLRMQPAGVITGKVLDGDGDPMPAVSVTVTPAGAGRSAVRGVNHTNDQGEYRIANLRPGRYLISALSSRDDSDETAEAECRSISIWGSALRSAWAVRSGI